MTIRPKNAATLEQPFIIGNMISFVVLALTATVVTVALATTSVATEGKNSKLRRPKGPGSFTPELRASSQTLTT